MRGLVLALLLLLLLGAAPAGAAVDDLPCVVCHPSRDRAAYKLLSDLEGVEVGRESAQALVCRSCHTGAVRDDRARLDRGGQHPVGITARAETPVTLTLYGNRRLECGTCHSPHGDHPAAQRWLRQPFAGGTLCKSCHRGHQDRHLGRVLAPEQLAATGQRGGRAGPAGEIECGTCHTPHGSGGPKLLLAPYGPEQDQFCRLCHGNLGVKGAAAAAPSQPCAACHRPHGAELWQLNGGDQGPCVACHAERLSAGEHPRLAPACSECHSMHSPVRPGGSAAKLLRLPTDNGFLCLTCHQESLGSHGPEVLLTAPVAALLQAKNLPVNGQTADCATCHLTHAPRDEPLLRIPRTIICLYCHPDQNPFGEAGPRAGVHPMAVPLDAAQGRRLAESGGRVGPRGELACNSCHLAHRQTNAAKVACITCHPEQVSARGHAGDGNCATCHAMHGEERRGLPCGECHQPVVGPHPPSQNLVGAPLPAVDPQGRLALAGTLQCPTCHDPHGDTAPLLRGESATATCLACHADKAAMATGSHALAAPGESLCGPCHPSHSETPTAEGEDPAAARCARCHTSELPVTQSHSRKGRPPWRQRVAALPLFDQQGQRNEYGFVSCPTCHDVHTGAGGRSMRAENRSPPELCLGCHNEKRTLLGSSHDPRRHAAAAETTGDDTCGACHPIHIEQRGPDAWGLGQGAQGTWNDRKCTPCHGRAENAPWDYSGATSHPVNSLLPKNMAAGPLPLYDALGGKTGRSVACTTCHDPHGTAAGDGGVVPYFLRLDPAGELCTGCHKPQTAVVGTAHDLTTTPDPLGPCSPCHVAHGATTNQALWWLEPAAGEYQPNRLCRSCHTRNGWAASDVPLLQHHMKDADEVRSARGTIYLQRPMLLLDDLALKSGAEPVIPLYQRDGTPGPSGNLQCISCHDPHQWSPMGPYVKPGFGALGPNVPTKFLRLEDPKRVKLSVCVVCHPNDADQRYQKYHRVWEDVGKTFQ